MNQPVISIPIILFVSTSAVVVFGADKLIYQKAIGGDRELRVYRHELPPPSEEQVRAAAKQHPRNMIHVPDRLFEFRYMLVSTESENEIWNAKSAWFPTRPDWGKHRLLGADRVQDSVLILIFEQTPLVWVRFISLDPEAAAEVPQQAFKLMQLSDASGPVLKSASVRGTLDDALVVTLLAVDDKQVTFTSNRNADGTVTWTEEKDPDR